jgi:AdoMet-dependent heme synthase
MHNLLPYTPDDFTRHPLMFYYEVTLACDLVCKHCRAEAQENPDPEELSTEGAFGLIDQIASFERKPMLCLTGGDPLKRHDLLELIAHAKSRGLDVALTPSATPLATMEAFRAVKEAGVSRLGISLDGADADTHDSFRGFEGSFERTMEMLENARSLELPVQLNTSLCRRNFDQLDDIAQLLSEKSIAMWAVFFLVPVGRGVELERISPAEYELTFERLWHHARTKPFGVKTTEAPHYRRFVMQQGGNPLSGPKAKSDPSAYRGHQAPLGVTDGKGVMFVNHRGEFFPAGFLPLCCGRYPNDSVVDIYQNHPTFKALQDPDQLKGNCGRCEFRTICGGSRARAYAVTGDPLATEPDCVYIPPPD